MRVLIKIQSSLKFMPACAEISSHSNVSSEFQTNSMRVRIKTWPWSRFRAKLAESLWNSARSTRKAEIIVGETFFAKSSFMEPTERAWFIICCYFKPRWLLLPSPLSIIQLFMIPVSARVFALRFFSKWFIFDYSCTLRDHVDWLVWNRSLTQSSWCLLTSMRDSPSQLIKTKLLRNFQRLRHLTGNDNCQFARLLLPRKKIQSPTEQTSSLYRRWFLASRFACASLNVGLHFEKRK